MFENPRRGRQAKNFTTNAPKILDLKSSSEQIFSENLRWVPLNLFGKIEGPLLSGSVTCNVTWNMWEKEVPFFSRSLVEIKRGKYFVFRSQFKKIINQSINPFFACWMWEDRYIHRSSHSSTRKFTYIRIHRYETYFLTRDTKTISPACSFIRGSSDHGVQRQVLRPSLQAISPPL